MVVRKIIKIDEEKCTGCGECIPDCPEGALQIIDGKARLVSDLFCDGLGACMGACPTGAMTVEEREAEPYDERRVMEEKIVPAGANTIAAHLTHLKEHGECDLFNEAIEYLKEKNIAIPDIPNVQEDGSCTCGGNEPEEDTLACGCPGTQVQSLKVEAPKEKDACGCGCEDSFAKKSPSLLENWPVQIRLVPPSAPYLKGARVVIVADCVPFAYPDLHEHFLKGKVALVGCPKLDDASYYQEKLTEMFRTSPPAEIEVVMMEVPCCSGLGHLVKQAVKDAGQDIPVKLYVIGVKGNIL